ncbi:twin transmembrane helix small protein [bacterium]|nr:twin transmembrane helix small protein [bacterium]
MQQTLTYALYGAIAAVTIVLALGILNLFRTDAKARTRSNQLMRLRVAVQFVAILILVALGWAAGVLR